MLYLTESRVEHVQSHAVTLLRTGNRNQSLIAVILRLVNLDHTTTHLPDLVDLLTAFTDDSTDHVIGNVNLLRERTTGHSAVHRLALGTAVRRGTDMRRHVRLGVRSSSVRCWLTAVLHRHGRVWRSSAVGIVRWVGCRRHVVSSAILVTAVVFGPAVMTRSWLRRVRNNLHASRDRTSRRSTACGIGRSCWATKTLIKLLEKSASDIVSGNMDSVCDTHNHERPFARHWETRVGCIQTSTRGFLDLSDASTTLTNDGADQNMRDQKAERVCFGSSS